MAKEEKPDETTIDELIEKCNAEFYGLQAQLGNNDGQDAEAASHERARFNIWIDSVSPEPFYGISRLDYQLRDSQSLKGRLKSHLNKLVKILQQARQPNIEGVDNLDLRGSDDPTLSKPYVERERIETREHHGEERSRQIHREIDELRKEKESAARPRHDHSSWELQTVEGDEAWPIRKPRKSPLDDHHGEEIIIGREERYDPPRSEAHDSVLSDQEILDDLEVQTPSHQARQIQRARRVIDMLLRLAHTVKRPAPDDLIMSGALVGTDPDHDPDVEQVRAQFPSISPYLAERLGKAIWKRRQYLIYKIRSPGKPSADKAESDQVQAIPHIESTKEGHARTNVNREAAERRQYAVYADGAFDEKPSTKGNGAGQEHDTSDAISVGEDNAKTAINQEFAAPPLGAEIELDLPPVPEEGTASKCPLCGEVFNPADSDFWVFHLEDDLRPYLCTQEDCNVGPHMYHRRKDWQRHEDTAHRRIWTCPFECDLAYDSPAGLTEHMKTGHHADEDPEILKSLTEASSRPSEPPKDLHCPLCESRTATIDKWYQHVGKHLQYLSYFSLPDRLRRVKSQTDDQGVSWISSSYVNSPSETQDIIAEGNVIETRHTGPKSQQAAVESEDTEHLSDTDSEVDTEGHLETIELDTGVVEQPEIQIRRRSRSASADTYGSRGRSQRSVEVVSGSPKIHERSESVVDRRSKDDRYHRWDRERFERDRRKGPHEEDDVIFRERSRRRSRSADRYIYREVGNESSRPVGDEIRLREYHVNEYGERVPVERNLKDQQPPKSKEEEAKADKERQYREFVERYELQKAKKAAERKELEARMEREIEEKKAIRERERMEIEKRIRMDMEEKQYKRERERKEMEEKIKLEMKRKEAERKDEEILLEKKVEEKMWKKLTAFGFQDHQIRGILKGDKAKTPKPGYEAKGPAQREFEERERMGRESDFYGRSQDPEPPREYYAPSQGYFNPVPEHRAGWQAPQPQGRPYADYEDYLEPIRFEDAEYRRYRIPFKAARTWKGMQKIVREIYQGSEVRDMDEDIISGRWQVLDADDNGILPSSWEMSVKPGYVYKLAFTRPQQNDRSYDRDRYVDERARPRESEIIIEDDRSRRRSRSPPIIIRREERPEQEPAQQRNPFAPVEPQQPSESYINPRTGSPLPPPPEPRPTIDIYNDFEPSRRPRRAKTTKAVSWDPYLEDESGWYPSLESATRGGFRRPGRDSGSRSLQPRQTVSYSYPPPPPPEHARGGPVFPKVHRDHVLVDTLKYYDLPWEYDRNDPNYIIILRDLQREEANVLFEHTSRLKEGRNLPAVTAGPSSEWNAAAPASTSYPVNR